ncbi:cyclic GMP-AMP synthase-like [Leucoraja erinacea]|uniref:cyclic GMP-AMP synthase-like n=1 Tax=Leucoraja erinaceus TaxID=7782 RepID=UPI0024590498|nr:cyclic GMP-AMP synthase-like [Leucoraja erinacea]
MSQKKAAVGAGHLPARATPVRPASCGRTAGGKAKGQRGGGPEARSNCASANPTDAHHSPAHLGEKDGAAHRDRGDGITGIRRCTVANEVILTKAARGKDTVPTKAARGKEVNAGDKRTDATMVAAGVKGKNANNTADGNDTGARVAAAGKETDHAKGKHANKDASGRKTKAAAAAGDGEVGRERDLNQVLRAVIEDLRIRSVERSQASRRVNVVVEHLVRQIKQDPIFDSIDTLTSGSYYERVKIFEPNEFDIMITVPVERVACQEVDIEGAFYCIGFKRCPRDNLLNRFVCDGLLSAEKMLCHLRKLIIDAVKLLPDSNVKVLRKKPGSPAVTLEIGGDGVLISLDMVLALKVKQSWPGSTINGLKIEEWLGTKVRTDFRRKHFYLVPKQQPLETTEGAQALSKKEMWRISFSHIEKMMIMNHGNMKTCCESGSSKCCRKSCLKLLKRLIEKLKEKHPRILADVCSYHAKTTLFHACVQRPKDEMWRPEDLAGCFLQLLDNFTDHLKRANLPHFFIPTYNLFDGRTFDTKNSIRLRHFIENERTKNFPIFG